MPHHVDAWLRHQQHRWLRPDAARWQNPSLADYHHFCDEPQIGFHPNEGYGWLTPRQFLADKPAEDHEQVGIKALKLFRVLKP